MQMNQWRQIGIASVLAVALLAGVGTCSYMRGKDRGRADLKLEQLSIAKKANAAATKINAVKTTKDSAQSAALKLADQRATQSSNAARREYQDKRSAVKISGDTVTVGDNAPIVTPELANLIHLADARASQDSSAMRVKDDRIVSLETLVADERHGRELAEERAEIAEKRADILEKEKRPRFTFKGGMVAGVLLTIATAVAVVGAAR